MSIREDIAIRLIEERTRLGYSQSDFARQLGMNKPEQLRRYENGENQIGTELLAKTAGLGVDVQYILTGVKSQNVQIAEKSNQSLVHIESGATANVISEVKDGGIVNISNRHVTQVKAEVKPNDEHISQEQASILRKLVDDIVKLEKAVKQKPKSHQAVWSALNGHCKVTRYLLIPYEVFPKAEKYLRMWIGRLNSAKKASKTDNTSWRNRKYAYIKINTKNTPEWLNEYLIKNFDVQSLIELNDEQLNKVYSAVSNRKRRIKQI